MSERIHASPCAGPALIKFSLTIVRLWYGGDGTRRATGRAAALCAFGPLVLCCFVDRAGITVLVGAGQRRTSAGADSRRVLSYVLYLYTYYYYIHIYIIR